MNPNEMNKMTSSASPENTGVPTPNTTPPMSGEKDGKTGATIGVLVIIIILVIGALYLWGERLVGTYPETPGAGTSEVFQPTESASSEVADIEADLSATNLEGLDADLENINKELSI